VFITFSGVSVWVSSLPLLFLPLLPPPLLLQKTKIYSLANIKGVTMKGNKELRKFSEVENSSKPYPIAYRVMCRFKSRVISFIYVKVN